MHGLIFLYLHMVFELKILPQGLGHNRMVGIGDDAARNRPRLIPFEPVVVDQNSHEFGDAKGGVRVVDVDGDFLVEFADIRARANVVADDTLGAGGDEEVLLNQAHSFTFAGAVVGVEVFGDALDEIAVIVLGLHLVVRQHAVVGEIAIDFGIPQAQRVDGLVMVADNRDIVGDGHNGHCVFVDEFERTVGLFLHVGVAVELDVD